MRFGLFVLLSAIAMPVAGEVANPLLGQWTREAPGSADGIDGDPRQRLIFTPEMMIVGTSEGMALRGYAIGARRIRAETRLGATYTFQMFGADRMCMVAEGTEGGTNGIGLPRVNLRRCYLRRTKPFDGSLVRRLAPEPRRA
ncbi:hypothetical protein CLG96_15020 [Sphingomonas oleivorans]|uniref:Uncharacterized protein n=1 Tax=Sphingomonas oleivorans TaxID=1735121 RepID=A0A2T5FUV4_9SPHN|nr:hypothetical protein [Sphingomonas oleivorans]PTQ08515.1 hypothetical protein CLG96_15020 [Sphingomonas oleivorans]